MATPRIFGAEGATIHVKPVDTKPKARLDGKTGKPVLDDNGHPTFKNGVGSFDAKGNLTGFAPDKPYRVVATEGDLMHTLADGTADAYAKPEALINQATFDRWNADIRAAWSALDDKAREGLTGSVFARSWTNTNGLIIVGDGQRNDAPDVIEDMFSDL